MPQNLSWLQAAWHHSNHKETASVTQQEANIPERRATAAWILKHWQWNVYLTSLQPLDRYNNHNQSCYVYILSCCLQAEKDRITFWKEIILGWGKESDSPVSRFDNADRKTMKSLQANPECQQLNATSVLPALNYHIFLLYLCSTLSASSVCLCIGK